MTSFERPLFAGIPGCEPIGRRTWRRRLRSPQFEMLSSPRLGAAQHNHLELGDAAKAITDLFDHSSFFAG